MKKNIAFGLFVSLVFFRIASATPYPAMGTSILTDPKLGLFFSGRGYQVKTEGTSWVQTADGSESLVESVRYQLKSAENKFSNASLALRIDDVGSSTKIDQYAKKWIKEYSQFGFEILGSQSIQLAGHDSLVIDLVQKAKAQQIRQVLIQNKKKVAIFTCSDQKAEFNKTLVSCNQVVRSFRWTE